MSTDNVNEVETYPFDYERLMLITGGHIFFQTLAAAVEFSLFDLLDKKPQQNVKELAQELNLDLKPLRILLLGLSSLKLLKKDNDRYSNSDLAKLFFTSNSPRSLVNIVRWQDKINYKAMASFADSIRANKNLGLKEFDGTEGTLYERLAHNPAQEKIFQQAMVEISDQSNKDFRNSVDLSDIKFLVDVGGGIGRNIINLAQKNSHLKLAVFDSPTVCKAAEANFQKYPDLQSRLATFKGNCFKDEFPKEADALLFCHFFTIWSEEENRILLDKAYRSLPSGGKVMIFNMIQHNTEDGPLSAAMGSPYFLTLATGKGMLYTSNEYTKWFTASGFSNVTVQYLQNDHAVIIGTKP